MAPEQQFELSIQETDDSELSLMLQACTKPQLTEFIRVELNIGLTLARYSKAVCATGHNAQAEEAVARARRAYDRALEAFTYTCPLGKWQERRLQGKLQELARLLQTSRKLTKQVYPTSFRSRLAAFAPPKPDNGRPQ